MRASARRAFDKPLEQIYIDINGFAGWLTFNGLIVKLEKKEENGKFVYLLLDAEGATYLPPLKPYSAYPSINAREFKTIVDAQSLSGEPRYVVYNCQRTEVCDLMRTYLNLCISLHSPVMFYSEIVRLNGLMTNKIRIKSMTAGLGPKGGDTSTFELVFGEQPLATVVCYGRDYNAIAPGYRLIENLLAGPNPTASKQILLQAYKIKFCS